MTETSQDLWAITNFGIFLATLFYHFLGDDRKPLSRIDHPWINTALFISLSLIFTLPRLYIDTVSPYPHANSYHYFRSKRVSAAFAFFYIWQQTLMPRRLQALFHFFVVVGGPDVRNIVGMEQLMSYPSHGLFSCITPSPPLCTNRLGSSGKAPVKLVSPFRCVLILDGVQQCISSSVD
jgi:hypothetical protein